MKLELLCDSGISEAHDFAPESDVIIGRGKDCQLRLADHESSREHSRIFWTNGRAFLADMGSTNGTIVNGRKIAEAPLSNGDTIQIGQSRLRVLDIPELELQGTTMLQMNDRQRSVVMSLDHREADILAAQAVSDSAADMAHENDVLRELCHVSQLVASETDEDAVLRAVLDRLHASLDADTACILKRGAEESDWEMVATSEASAAADSVQVSQTLIDQAVKEGKAIISADPLSDDRFAPSRSIVTYRISSAICSPLKVGGEYGGVLSIDRRQKRQVFNAMDLRLVASAANIVGLFMEKLDYERASREQARLAVIGEVVAGLAHYIKNVVTGFRISLDGLRMALKRERYDYAGTFVESISSQESRISDLMLNMLSYAKDRTPVRENVSIAKVVESIVDPFRPRLEADGILFQFKADPDVPAVHVEEMSLHRAFLNLFTNSMDVLKAAPEGNEKLLRVTVRPLNNGKTVSIRFYDTGGGIAQDRLDRIFQAFYSTKGSGGTGLGLAVVQKVMQEHGGTVSVESEEGRWTAFNMELPAAPPDASKPPTAEARGPVLKLKQD